MKSGVLRVAGGLAGSVLVAGVLAACGSAVAPESRAPAPIVRHTTDAPIATAVTVPAGHSLVFLSGVVPSPANPDAPAGTPEYWGDTKTQTLSVLGKIKDTAEGLGHGMGDVVSMTVFLGADRSKDPQARMDFAGMMEAYRQFFGADAGQPNLPSRSTVEVANLVGPGMLVEIEVTLAVPPPAS